MKTVFICNEYAGKKNTGKFLGVSALADDNKEEVSVYTTKSVGDACEYVNIIKTYHA